MILSKEDCRIINGLCNEAIEELNMIRNKSGLEIMPFVVDINGSKYSTMHDIETDSYYIMLVDNSYSAIDVYFEGTKEEVTSMMIDIIKESAQL